MNGFDDALACRLPARRMVQHTLYHAGIALDLFLSVLARLETTNWCNIAAGLFEADLSKVSKQGDLTSSRLLHVGRSWASRTCASTGIRLV